LILIVFINLQIFKLPLFPVSNLYYPHEAENDFPVRYFEPACRYLRCIQIDADFINVVTG